MKQGWELKKLGEVCDLINGSTPFYQEEDNDRVKSYLNLKEK